MAVAHSGHSCWTGMPFGHGIILSETTMKELRSVPQRFAGFHRSDTKRCLRNYTTQSVPVGVILHGLEGRRGSCRNGD